MLVRLVRIDNVDINLFEHDYDLTWMAFFLNAKEQIYGRYGSRDEKGPDSRMSLAGLEYAMQQALLTHRQPPKQFPARKKPLSIRQYPSARNHRGCIHCHQVKEIQRAELRRIGKWDRDSVWRFPLPENIGLTLEIDRGNVVRQVHAKSSVDRAGIVARDVIKSINNVRTASIADVQYALDRSPSKGKISITWLHQGKEKTGQLILSEGWRKTKHTWRPSLLALLPSLPLYGIDLTIVEKRRLKLSDKQLAFRQENQIQKEAREAGIRPGDIILGINNQQLEMDVFTFLGYVRRNYLVGETVEINLIRGQKRVNVKMKLR